MHRQHPFADSEAHPERQAELVSACFQMITLAMGSQTKPTFGFLEVLRFFNGCI